MVEIIKHHSKPFTYIISSGQNMLGELVEDDIMNVLKKAEVNRFYHNGQTKFLVPMNKIRNLIVKPKYY
jgi:hypothetical protein|tara:strand:+ start:5966 stop:6172 length:207 start_codon:yes stop_codon:yes gene_type:complete